MKIKNVFKKKKIKIGLIGGKLQGVEAAYLSKIENYFLVLIDKNRYAFAKIFADKFEVFDITKHIKKYYRIINKLDYLIPLNENKKTLRFIEKNKDKIKCKILFDFNAYNISQNKKESKVLFKKLGLLTPGDKPMDAPYFIKPNNKSGSCGARLVNNSKELTKIPKDYLIEKYIVGPIISLEIIGNRKEYYVGMETRIHIDEYYDCFRVTPLKCNEKYREIAIKVAKVLNLDGIMDIEAIEHGNELILLEIDARFPSQTPICVYHSSKINLITQLLKKENLTLDKNNYFEIKENNYCILEHFEITKQKEIIYGGEHIISKSKNFEKYYIDEVNGIKIFRALNNNNNFVYTLICYGINKIDTINKQKIAFDKIKLYN